MPPWRFYFIIILMLSALSACKSFHPAPVQLPPDFVPESFSRIKAQADPGLMWWMTFQDEELNAFIEDAFDNNLNLKTLWARVEQARASAIKSGADLYPFISAAAGTVHTRRDGRGNQVVADSTKEYSIGFTGVYEADIWGKNRAERQAAIYAVEAGEHDYSSAVMALTSEITRRWLQVISQRMQIRLLHDQLSNNEIMLELIKLRFRQAMVSILDVYQQQQVIDNIRAQIPLVELQKRRLINELAILLGKAPQGMPEISAANLPDFFPVPDTGIPVQLLENRPDIRAAQSRLQAAGWNVAAARADRLPNLSFSARSSFNSRHLDLLLDSWLLSLASNLAVPVFDANLRVAEIDRLKAVEDENMIAYRQVVLSAIREVEDAVVTEIRQVENIERLRKVMDTAGKALDQAIVRYRNGLSDYLPVLTQILTVQNLDRNLIDQETILLVNRVDLYLALGGTWATMFMPSAMPGKQESF